MPTVWRGGFPDLLSPFRARFGYRWQENGQMAWRNVVVWRVARHRRLLSLADPRPNAWATSLFNDAPSCRTAFSGPPERQERAGVGRKLRRTSITKIS